MSTAESTPDPSLAIQEAPGLDIVAPPEIPVSSVNPRIETHSATTQIGSRTAIKYIDRSDMPAAEAERALKVNLALTKHAVISDQDIANALDKEMVKKELMRLDRGATIIDRIKESVTMPDFKDKLKKLAWNGLKYGYWGFFAYGVLTGTSPIGVVKDIVSIPGRIGDLVNTGADNLISFLGLESKPAGGPQNTSGDILQSKIPSGRLFDTPVFDDDGEMTNKGGTFFNLFKPLLGKDLATSLTKTVGTPFVGIFGSLAQNTKYPVEGKWGPFLAYPAVYYGGKKLGLWNELYTRLKGDSTGNLNQMKRQEIEALKEKARNELLSGNWEGYSEIRLAIDNIGERYKGIENQLIRQRRALVA